jgi:hypothetical protein
MKALSIKQPWANLIVSGEKTIETRVWATPYRGRVLLVSSKTPNIDPAGFALGTADLVECRPMTKRDEQDAKCLVYPKAVAWILQNIKPVKPFPVKGQLGLFDVEVPEERLLPHLPLTQPSLF